MVVGGGDNSVSRKSTCSPSVFGNEILPFQHRHFLVSHSVLVQWGY